MKDELSQAQSEIDKDDIRFSRTFQRVILVIAALVFLFLVTLTFVVLQSNPTYLHDWRGITCITLTTFIIVLYGASTFRSLKLDWPVPLPIALTTWVGMYLAVVALSSINNTFSWDFYIVFSVSFALFGGRLLLLAIGAMMLTMFVFQDLLPWPPKGGVLFSIVTQALTLCSIAGFVIMFQHLMEERFKRNELFRQLAQANGELEEAHRQLAQSVAQEQELAVLRERTRLAREMHDTIGHALVLISVKLEAAQRLRERDPARCDRELESTKEVARETMTALRASIADLRTPALEHEHINQALSRSTREFAQRTGLHVTYTLTADIDQLPEPIEETLWKVSQEAFTNIEKHAQAHNVNVCIDRQDERLHLSIHDDGIGLPPALCQAREDGSLVYKSPANHYGLRGMLERVESVGGHLILRSARGQGTTLEIELPLTSTAARAVAMREQG